MKIGYSFWGFLGDVKCDREGNTISTPDGNAFYSWSIIKELQRRGNEVFNIMPDRDTPGFMQYGPYLFNSWCKEDRTSAYMHMSKLNYNNIDWSKMSMEDLYNYWDLHKLNESDIILHEWRMCIPGRNDDRAKNAGINYQPDLFIQECLINYCALFHIPIIIFDLDYKLDSEILESLILKNKNTYIFELGNKWGQYKNLSTHAYHVEIPFDFSHINDLSIKRDAECTKSLVYIGNRYERDWCIDKYIPTEIRGIRVFGNWKESGRDSEERWPDIEFCSRLQTKDMYYEYSTSLCTILLAKKEYLENSFMTARIIESVFYGCVPLFIEEYGEETIYKYAGIYNNDLTVRSKSDVIDMVYFLHYNEDYRKKCIEYLRKHLSFMDVKYFVDSIYEVCEVVNDGVF